jgi:hypothetical protein
VTADEIRAELRRNLRELNRNGGVAGGGDIRLVEVMNYALLCEIAAQLAELNEQLRSLLKGESVLNVETGLDKGEPLPVAIIPGGGAL